MNTWIVVADNASVAGPLALARTLGEVSAVVVGRRDVADRMATSGVTRVVHIPVESAPVEAAAATVAEIIAQAGADVVIGAARPGDRALLGAICAKLGAPAYAEVVSVAASENGTVVEHNVYGGIARQTLTVNGPVVLVTGAGGDVPQDGAACPVEESVANALGVRLVENRPTQHTQVDLAGARRVVGVGRGLKSKDDLALIDQLAAALGAEIACSRPIAEGLDWLPKDRYLGVSGQHIAPELYVAVGISGQFQHTIGVRDARTVVVINTDADAPYFTECDHGVVGDLYDVVPELVKALS